MGKCWNDPQGITFETKDKVACVMLNRPEKRNAPSIRDEPFGKGEASVDRAV